MDNYGEILEKEKKLTKKRDLVEDTIVADKLTKHEIISKMYHGLVNEIEELKVILFADLSVTNNSKEKEKIFKIAFALQTCLDMEKGEKWFKILIGFTDILDMSKRIQDNECMNFVQPAIKLQQV